MQLSDVCSHKYTECEEIDFPKEKKSISSVQCWCSRFWANYQKKAAQSTVKIDYNHFSHTDPNQKTWTLCRYIHLLLPFLIHSCPLSWPEQCIGDGKCTSLALNCIYSLLSDVHPLLFTLPSVFTILMMSPMNKLIIIHNKKDYTR